jgi:hypothetical protein
VLVLEEVELLDEQTATDEPSLRLVVDRGLRLDLAGNALENGPL